MSKPGYFQYGYFVADETIVCENVALDLSDRKDKHM